MATIQDELRLPHPWRWVRVIPAEDWRAVETVLGAQLDEADSETARWDELVHSETGERALIRIHAPERDEARISGVALLPPTSTGAKDGKPVIRASTLRDFPVSAVSAAYVTAQYRARNAAMDLLTTGEAFDVDKPIGRPTRGDEKFHRRLALQYLHFADQVRDPTQAIADVNEVPRGTVKRWLVETRKKGNLPPGKPGRIAKGADDAQN